jgi:hypothetical protein
MFLAVRRAGDCKDGNDREPNVTDKLGSIARRLRGGTAQVSVTSGTQEAKHSLDRASELEPRFRRARVRRSRSAGSGAGAAAAMAASNR